MISAILLAAGESRRMGEFKQLLRLGEKTFVEHCVDTLLQSRVAQVIVVTGHRDADVRSILRDRNVICAHNSEYRLGMATSIKCGVQVAASNAQTHAFLLALVDQPQISSLVIDSLIKRYDETSARIVVPTYDGRNGHPILLDRSLKEEILGMDPTEGLRSVVRQYSGSIVRVEVTSSSVVEDCDLPEDYQRLVTEQ